MTISDVKGFFIDNSPVILLTLGIIGVSTAIVSAIKATPKAIKLLEERDKKNPIPPTPIEVVKTCYKPYVKAALIFIMALCCIVSSHSVNVRRNAALAAAYTISDTALREYKDKAIDILGKDADQRVTDAIAKDKIEKNKVVMADVILTEKGNSLCYDVLSGRYFRSSIEKLRQAECEINNELRSEDYCTLNEFYYAVGLPTIEPLGDDLGWNVNKGYLKLEFSSQISCDGEPCIVVGYSVAPQLKYNVDYVQRLQA